MPMALPVRMVQLERSDQREKVENQDQEDLMDQG